MKSCKICHEPVEDDGYGEPVHKDTGFYGAYSGNYSFEDPRRGELTHVAV